MFPWFVSISLMLCFWKFPCISWNPEVSQETLSYLGCHCVCVCLSPVLSCEQMSYCISLYGAASFRLKQSTWCYWFQRIFLRLAVGLFHRSVHVSQKAWKMIFKVEGEKRGVTLQKDRWAAPRTFIQRGFKEETDSGEPTYTWCELWRLSGFETRPAWSLCQPVSCVGKKKTKKQKPTRACWFRQYPRSVSFKS